jgi:hypothetical protein
MLDLETDFGMVLIDGPTGGCRKVWQGKGDDRADDSDDAFHDDAPFKISNSN